MHVLIVGGTAKGRRQAADSWEEAVRFRPASRLSIDARSLPFVRAVPALLPPAQPRLLRLDDLHLAFPDCQASGTRLILTQSTYTLQKWVDLAGRSDRIVATADLAALRRNAPEALKMRGAWRYFSVQQLAPDNEGGASPAGDSQPAPSSVEGLLAQACMETVPENRVALCRQAMATRPDSAVAALALASACREVQDLAAAREALDVAKILAPDWEAVHYEDGKFWLGCEEIERARAAFQQACAIMPTFSAAFSNLGATLGELDEREAAVAAFQQALAHDPDNFTILNNIGVVNRELGRLEESERALCRVTALAREFVFGHYNLGHTRLLRGDFAGALAAYEEGQRRDPEKNRRQGCRLALARFATGDLAGATRDLWRFADAAPPEEREDLLLEAYETAAALMQTRPDLSGCRAFVDQLAAEIAKPSHSGRDRL
jgi:tetratricopeptide (TPR) repeat protein